jgi:hypothetical protein
MFLLFGLEGKFAPRHRIVQQEMGKQSCNKRGVTPDMAFEIVVDNDFFVTGNPLGNKAGVGLVAGNGQLQTGILILEVRRT